MRLLQQQDGAPSAVLSYDRRIGEILVARGAVTEDLIDYCLEYQQATGLRLGEALVKLNFVTEEVMRQGLCAQLNIPFFSSGDLTVDRDLARLINKKYAQKHQIIPLAMVGDTLTVAMDDPTNRGLIEELRAFSGLSINVVTSTPPVLQDTFHKLYGDPGQWETTCSPLEVIEEEAIEDSECKYSMPEGIKRADRLVRYILNMGLDKSATDIHLEAVDRQLVIRYRIDGVLQEARFGAMQSELNRHRHEVISRIKILGKLDIAERRRPHDGSFRVRVAKNGQSAIVDFRISIVPAYYGENVVLRILDNRNAPQSIDQLGFCKKTTDAFRQLLQRNTGIILITGPTGSGKTTTLYGALMTLAQPGVKILTAEDPIEYVYDSITQCEVNRKLDNTFASYVRAFLRQDPEIIMIGEIRDTETAEMAFRAAQTGHLVLSSLHTNDAISSVTRLLGLGVDPNLITSCLLGVISQRLVRQICHNCKEECTPPKELLEEFFVLTPADIRWFKGKKCPHCNHTGYRGRFPVAELWAPNEDDVILISKGASIDELRKSSYKSTIFMAEDAMDKLRARKTGLEELMRTLPYSSILQFRCLSGQSHRAA